MIGYKIAGIVIHLNIPFPCAELREYREYRVDPENAQADVTVTFTPRLHPVTFSQAPMCINDKRFYETKTHFYMEQLAGDLKTPFLCLVQKKEDIHQYQCYYYGETIWRLESIRQVFEAISLEHILSRFHAFILHTSFVQANGKAILFSAPSGGGKSTQAELWKNTEGAEIINGDRAVIRREGAKWYACGLPYAGSSNIYKNKSFPIRAVVILKKSPVNKIRRMAPAQAFKSIVGETAVHLWDQMFYNTIFDLITELIEEIPVYELQCRPDEQAVKTLKRTLEDR